MKACIALAKKEQEDGHIEAAKNIFVDLCQNKLNPEGCYLAKNFQKACDMGYGMGCLEIGVQHFNKLEYTQAIPFLEKACEQDTNSACFRLEKTKSRKKAKEVCMNSPKRCLIFADYLARDSFTKESYFYYKKACDNGNDEACTKLKK